MLRRHLQASARAARLPDGTQEARILVQHGYHPSRIELEAGVPAVLRFERRETDRCSELLVSELLPSSFHLAPNAETDVRFTPTAPGTYAFTCGLGMYTGVLVIRSAPPARMRP